MWSRSRTVTAATSSFRAGSRSAGAAEPRSRSTASSGAVLHEIRGLDHAQEVRDQLEGLTIDLPARAGDTGKLFGAVTAGDIAAAIKKAGGPSVDKRAVQISKPIKTVGLHTVGVKLHDAVTAHVRLVVDKA